ncbi:CCCH-type zinc finger-containing protein [Encephalitozoon intestinalis ATCC 50506]|uniref:CCCH-type zinc finger-containing protein n=1 Tax=Encephalitozoon intestinalis (strain ATCC 50506) TaxID=876142 RepID=E0S8W2_ENCIT|nr:CCCH-type zinc finger-containing protein [Encephalitozoon intestinalis ATCC 50506]ADM12228.1 CCCH-type zinc finger-containing protein [Encephalitozoon intestinalis ATCC 50506]UTX46037.1 DRG-like protein [Encephalitozoon intestinalis]
MAKKQQETKQKSIRDIRKELEEKAFGLKNKKQKAAILKQIESLNLKEQLEKKEKMKKEEKNVPVKQVIPVGVDPKTIQCVNFLNKICPDGDACKFAHKEVKKVEKPKEENASEGPKRICQFLIDALNSGEYGDNWKCPFPKCVDIHRLVEIKENAQVELSLEEYIELSRQSLPEKLTPLTEETFKQWKLRKQKEEKEHARKVKAIATGMKGIELFEARRELFKDDEEAEDLDYTERCYSESEDEEDHSK